MPSSSRRSARSSSTSRSRWESVSATAKRRDAGLSSAPKRSNETVVAACAASRRARPRRASRSRWCSISSRARPTGSAIGSPWPGSAIAGASSIVRSQRVEVVAERVGPALGLEADRRRDPAEQVVGRRSARRRASRQRCPSAWPGRGDEPPAVELVARRRRARVRAAKRMNGRVDACPTRSAPP